MSRSRAPEAPRDQDESGFTLILRRLWAAEPDVLAVCFVDHDGECVDYCSSLAPFDAKVAGAHLSIIMTEMREPVRRLGGGRTVELCIHALGRDFVARQVSDDYLLVVVVRGGMVDPTVHRAIDLTVEQLRAEANVPTPTWDPLGPELEIELREAVGWDWAPAAILEGDARTPIADVLGRWEESGGAAGGYLVCFRVRTVTEKELTLAFDAVQGRWLRW